MNKRNSYTYLYEQKLMPKKTIINHLIDTFMAIEAKRKRRRKPITRIRRIWAKAPFSTWYWQCKLCDHNMKPRDTGSTHYGELCFTWAEANRRATHHAHNHHRSQK